MQRLARIIGAGAIIVSAGLLGTVSEVTDSSAAASGGSTTASYNGGTIDLSQGWRYVGKLCLRP